MEGNLGTTNVLLGIMAAVSVLQALVLIGAGIAGFMVYRKIMHIVSDLEARQIAPLREKVEAILGDVKTVTARVSHQSERVDHAISGTMDRVDETAERVKHSVKDKVNQGIGVARGIRAVVASVLSDLSGRHDDDRPHSAATAEGRF
jgi:gas vesicle protein